MAINRDPAEWFERFDREETYGIVKATDKWLVLRKWNLDFGSTKIDQVAQVDSRQAAIGYIKLLVEN